MMARSCNHTLLRCKARPHRQTELRSKIPFSEPWAEVLKRNADKGTA